MGKGNTLTAWLFATAMEFCVISLAGCMLAIVLGVPDTTTNILFVIFLSLAGALANIEVEM